MSLKTINLQRKFSFSLLIASFLISQAHSNVVLEDEKLGGKNSTTQALIAKKANKEDISLVSNDTNNNPQIKNIQNANKTSIPIIKNYETHTKKDSSKSSLDSQYFFVKKYNISIDDSSFKALKLDYKKLEELLKNYTNRDINQYDLANVVEIITFYFRSNGYISATAYIPDTEKKFTIDENVNIRIALGKLGKVILKNQSSVRDSVINSQIPKRYIGKIITTSNLEDIGYKVNELYGLETSVGLKAGENYGESDIVLNTEQGEKASALFFVDNHGIESTGRYRGGVSLDLNNLLRYGENYNFIVQGTNEKQFNFSANYNFFLGNLKINPNISKGRYTIGKEFEGLGFYGESLSMGVNFSYPLWINTKDSFYLTSSINHKRLQDTYFETFESKKKSNSISFGVQGTLTPIARDNLSYTAYTTFGNVKDNNGNLKIDSVGYGNFLKFNANINNNFFFNDILTHTTTVNFQKVLGEFALDNSESYALGGNYGVRAYDNGSFEADNAIQASFGLRINPIKNFYITPFYDLGYGWYEDKTFEEYFIDAVGIEFMYFKSGNYYGKLSLASALHKYKHDDEKSKKIFFSFGKYFF
ncbi:ShlB/FhaC/HecB family hemolysin secretion/activation protein [Campylobacter coli]|nr:ShlB/FhaC/HecB family hemolysin secretion/activation protein [Campylobacter coli]